MYRLLVIIANDLSALIYCEAPSSCPSINCVAHQPLRDHLSPHLNETIGFLFIFCRVFVQIASELTIVDTENFLLTKYYTHEDSDL